MKKIIITMVASLLMASGCGISETEKNNIASVTCSILKETKMLDSAIRVEKVNEAREKLKSTPYLDGDEEIVRSLAFGTCDLLVKNDANYQTITESKEQTFIEEARLAQEKKAVGERPEKAKADIAIMGNALEMYRLERFNYPNSELGLKALLISDNLNTRGYIRILPKDPWGNDYQYVIPGENGEYDLFSKGADGEIGGEGINADIGNWDP